VCELGHATLEDEAMDGAHEAQREHRARVVALVPGEDVAARPARLDVGGGAVEQARVQG
jgi:hypothetical protein